MAEALWAAFDTPDGLAEATRALRDRRVPFDVFAPYAVNEVVRELPEREHFGPMRTGWQVLPWVALVAGLLGGLAGYLIQWFANSWAYPQNAGGRPANAVPAFVFNTFESIVLIGSGAVFLALLVVLKLPRLWNPLEAIDGYDRVTDDRFGVLVEGPPLSDVERLLRGLGAAEIRRVEVP